jgi:hypothetical protein
MEEEHQLTSHVEMSTGVLKGINENITAVGWSHIHSCAYPVSPIPLEEHGCIILLVDREVWQRQRPFDKRLMFINQSARVSPRYFRTELFYPHCSINAFHFIFPAQSAKRKALPFF